MTTMSVKVHDEELKRLQIGAMKTHIYHIKSTQKKKYRMKNSNLRT